MTKPLEAYTEKAMSLLGGALVEVAYLPPSLRTRPMPQDASAEDDDQLGRIMKADPVGFLVAIMQGRSLASFTVKPLVEERPDAKRTRGRPKKKETATARIKIGEESGHAIYAEFHSPSVADRERVAMFLAKFVARNNSQSEEQLDDRDHEFELVLAKRAAQAAQLEENA